MDGAAGAFKLLGSASRQLGTGLLAVGYFILQWYFQGHGGQIGGGQ